MLPAELPAEVYTTTGHGPMGVRTSRLLVAKNLHTLAFRTELNLSASAFAHVAMPSDQKLQRPAQRSVLRIRTHLAHPRRQIRADAGGTI